MHSIHFAFSLGATIGPILAAPFLSEGASSEDLGDSRNHSHVEANMTLAISKETKIDQNNTFSILQCRITKYLKRQLR